MKGFGLADHVRISIGLPEENERFIKALGGILAKRSGAR
jgi:histidinol-phosphate/aromatic aminotransferase/cobyric acid decarboxylase-like protein